MPTERVGMRFLVTGGAGFIGCHFIRYLLQHYPAARVVNLDALTYAGCRANLADVEVAQNNNRYHFVQGDIVDKNLVTALLEEHAIDTIVHFAAESHVDRSIDQPAEFIQTNVLGTFMLLEAAREVWLKAHNWTHPQCRFHHISTDEVYGSLGKNDAAFTEQTAYAPNSPYSASKAGSDHLVRAFFHTYGLPITISNCSNNYGPYQHREKFIPTIIRSVLAGETIPVYGRGDNIRDWLYVEDHCRAIDAVLRGGCLGAVYNVGGDNEWSNLAVARAICQQLDALRDRETPSESLIKFVTDRAGHDWRYAMDTRKIRQELNWQPQEDFASGLAKTIRYYLDDARA